MRINRLNYEKYLADYLDGNLDPLLSEELMTFLSNNPDIEKLWLEPESQHHMLSARIFHCPDKEALKKNYADIEAINEFNFDEFCIAEIEGILTAADRKRLSEYISLHPKKAGDHKLFRHTLIRPDHNVQYPGKENLKRKVTLISGHNFTFYILRVAAAIAVLILMITIKPEKKSGSLESANAIITSGNKQEKNTSEKIILDTEDKAAMSRVIKVKIDAKEKVPDNDDYGSPVVLPLKASIPAGLLPSPDIISRPVERSLNGLPEIPDNSLSYTAMTTEKTAAGEMPDLLDLLHKVNVLKTAEGIVKGFNHLTEANLELKSTVNNEGKLSELVIKSESFVVASFNKN